MRATSLRVPDADMKVNIKRGTIFIQTVMTGSFKMDEQI
jgi:hypothetical protein